ncbi:unnamed protein product [Acanthosepion pharaonis]|uniref:Uncharacterized protein n=1 Tax=Acanthosepion pharaonis TaxID=158019 RepID=A0A812BG66_ACAPH|nr:unnamed protein product [Sepia pharaonis]
MPDYLKEYTIVHCVVGIFLNGIHPATTNYIFTNGERGSVACLLIAICRPEPLRSLLSRLQPSRGKMRGEGVRKKKDKEKGRTFFFSQLSMVIFDSRFPVIDDKVCLRKEEHTFCFVLPPLAPPFHPDSPASQVFFSFCCTSFPLSLSSFCNSLFILSPLDSFTICIFNLLSFLLFLFQTFILFLYRVSSSHRSFRSFIFDSYCISTSLASTLYLHMYI